MRVLLIFRHGLGDAVQLTSLLAHLKTVHPNWEIDVATSWGKHSAVQHLVHATHLHDKYDESRYNIVKNIGWGECRQIYPCGYGTKVENSLHREFGLDPPPAAEKYSIQIGAEAWAAAERWLVKRFGDCRDPHTGKFPVAFLHYEGNTAAGNKNLGHDQAERILAAIRDAGYAPVLLDWDYRSPLQHGPCGVVCPDRDDPYWLGHGTGDAERLAALLQRCELMVGVDSGPQKVALAAGIPTICLFTGHNPLHYLSPHDNATVVAPTKVVPEDQREAFERLYNHVWVEDVVEGACCLIRERRRETPAPARRDLPPPTDGVLTNLTGRYLYRRVGYDERPIELMSDGTIGEGAAARERVWKTQDTPVGHSLMFYSEYASPTCQMLLQSDGVLRGRWMECERMPVELVPLDGHQPKLVPRNERPSAPLPQRFFVGIPTLNRFDLLPDAIDAILAGSAVPERIYVVDNSSGCCPRHASEKVEIITPPYNLGCSRSWNLLMQLTHPAPCIICSDDVWVGHNTLQRMLEMPEEFVCADGGRAFMLFMIRSEAWRRVGYFDETYYPVYHEDNDYAMRLKLAGFRLAAPQSDGFRDLGPSATHQRISQEPEFQARWWKRYYFHQQYYRNKWGAGPHQETFDRPWNGASREVQELPLALMDADIAREIQEVR